jgi:hypothetical protein
MPIPFLASGPWVRLRSAGSQEGRFDMYIGVGALILIIILIILLA